MGRQRGPASADVPAEKTCTVCGRRIEWRARWARDWEQVRYCSDACRHRGLRAEDKELERTLLELLDARALGATVCPSEAARLVAAARSDAAADTDPPEGAWRALMEPARMAARRLVANGAVVITQGGRVVDPSTAKGPIRVRRA